MEARVPFLDLNLVDFALRIPDSMKYGPSGPGEVDSEKGFSAICCPGRYRFEEEEEIQHRGRVLRLDGSGGRGEDQR